MCEVLYYFIYNCMLSNRCNNNFWQFLFPSHWESLVSFRDHLNVLLLGSMALSELPFICSITNILFQVEPPQKRTESLHNSRFTLNPASLGWIFQKEFRAYHQLGVPLNPAIFPRITPSKGVRAYHQLGVPVNLAYQDKHPQKGS